MTDESSIGADSILRLAEEHATVTKKPVETGRVRISTHVEEHHEVFREALRHEDVVVERVAINRIVETIPAIRQEGDTVIYPIVEETLIVEKRLILKEELHIICTSRVETVEQEVTLRAMHADVQRTSAPRLKPDQD